MKPGSRVSESYSLWHNRNFAILRAGQGVSVIGSEVSRIGFPLLVLAITRSPLQAGVVGFFNTIPNLLINLPAGALVDRWRCTHVMLTCDTIRAVAIGSVPLAAWLGYLTLPQLYLVGFVEGSLAVVFTIADQALVPRIVAEEHTKRAVSLNLATEMGALMVGQPIGGLLFSIGRTIPFLADALSYSVSVASILFVKIDPQVEINPARQRLLDEIREGVRWLWHNLYWRTTVIVAAGINLWIGARLLILIVLAKQLHASPVAIGLIFSLGGLGGVVGSLLAPRIERFLGTRAVVMGAVWVLVALFPLYVLAPHPIVLGLILAVNYATGIVWTVVMNTYGISIAPSALLGRLVSVTRLIAWGTRPVGWLLGGLLLQFVGAKPSVVAFGAWVVFLAIWMSLNPHMRHIPGAAAPQQASG